MLGRVKKHSVKILVFFTNILLAAVAVLIIRGKDQVRLIENLAGKKSDVDTPSFKGNLKLDSPGGNPADTSSEIQSDPADQNSADNSVMPSDPIPSPSTAPAVPAPTVKQPAAPDRKTKTS